MSKNVCYIAGIFSIILLILLSFGISLVIINNNSKHSVPESEICPDIGKPYYWEAKKQLFKQWNWEYKIQGISSSGKIQHLCPTITHNAQLFINKTYAGHINNKLFTTVSKSEIVDCHGDITHIIRTGDLGDMLINHNKIKVSLQVWDPSEEICYGAVDAVNFMDNTVTIIDVNSGGNIAKIYRDKLVDHAWIWEFTIYNSSNILSDPNMLMLLAGKISFDGDNTDICNQYFTSVSIALIVLGCCFIVYIATLFYYSYTSKRNNCNNNSL